MFKNDMEVQTASVRLKNGNNMRKNYAIGSSNERESDNKGTSCGIGGYSPSWLQLFASKKVYVLIYGILGMNQTAIGSYFIGTISTIEKRFKLPSSTTGLIASSWDFGALCTVLAITYFGSMGHKTRWVAFCSLFTSISCFLRYVPYLLYGPNTKLTPDSSSFNLCKDYLGKNNNCSLNAEGLITSIILTVAHIALGIGTSTYNTLGAAYLDDNSLKNKAPFLIALVTCFRYLGPTIGFLLASYALQAPEIIPPSQGQNDQQWIGAWQFESRFVDTVVGWIPLGTVHLFLSLMMAFFPKTLPREAERRKSRNHKFEAKTKWSFNDLRRKFTKLLWNPILMFNILGSTSYMFGTVGYMIFMPKYIETQFLQSASRANLITGTIGLVCTLIGIMLSGYLISKFKPHPRSLAAWNFCTKLIEVIVHILFAFISCEKGRFYGINDERLNFISMCNVQCNCSIEKYAPVCALESKTTYFSACHAGCKTNIILNNTMVYGDCSCASDLDIITDGSCQTNCEDHFYIFLMLFCFLRFLSSTGRAGSTIMQYRSVDPDDKSLALAMNEVMICGLAFIPAPIIYGLILDSSCLVWEEECGRKGNCLLYNEKILRFYLNFTASGLLFLATLFDYGVFRSVKMLNIYDDENEAIHEESDVNKSLNNKSEEVTTIG